MALATKDPDNDERLNPGSWDESTGARLSSAEQESFDGIADNFDSDADSSTEDANIAKARSAEGAGGSSQWRRQKATPEAVASKGKQAAEKDERGKQKDKIALSFMKKKGPLALIGLLLAGGGGLFTALLSPGLAIVQIKEALMEDLNDAVSAMDERSQHIFRAKMKGQVSGVCTKKVSARCKYKSMSKTQLKKMAKAGFEVKVEPERRSLKNGRYNVKSITFVNGVDADGKPIKKTVTANNFKSEYRNNPAFRSGMNKYYSARWMSVNGKEMGSVKNKFKLSFKRLLNGKNKTQMKDQLNSNVKEGASERDGRKVAIVEKDGKKVYVDESGNEIKDTKTGKPLDPDVEEKKINDIKKLSGGGTGKMLSTGLKSANIYGGTQEMVCSVLSMLRLAGVASRNYKFAQLMRYAIPFLNTADSIKTGTATPEATEFVGDILTKEDMRDMLVTEESMPVSTDSSGKKVLDGALQGNEPASISPVKNPHKGKNAFDSAGIKAAMYGTTETMDMRQSQSSLSGALGSAMVGLVDEIRNLPLAPSEGECSFWKNPVVQGAGFVLSVGTIAVSCIVSGCAGAMPGIAKAVATTAVSMFITAWVSNQINDMVNGDIISADAQGLDAGNALFTGTAAYASTSASTRGMTPLSSPGEIQQKNLVALKTKMQNAEVDKFDARDTPLDIYNQYSFLGSIVWSLAPVARASSSTMANILSAPVSLLSSIPSWLSPTAGALVASGPDRYTKCDDEVFRRMNLNSADIMCNLRWGLSDAQLNADPNKVVQWMIDSCQVDPISGELNASSTCQDGCKPGDAGTESCQRTTTPEQALAMLSTTPGQVASAMAYDKNEDSDMVADGGTTQATLAAHTENLPPNITRNEPDFNENDPVKDVRTYAHFLRYCRYGPEEGARTVNFGDPDSEEGDVLTGLNFQDAYSSIGKECLTENNCEPDNPEHANPNNAFRRNEDGSSIKEAALRFCRPPQYDIYAVYTMDKLVEEGMDQEDEGEEESSDGLVTGEAKELAKKVAENQNIEFTNAASKEALLEFANTGQATNACGEKYAINPLLSGVMLTMADKWKMKVNNFGFESDRSFCDGSPINQHRMGNAIDLNGIQKVGGDSAGSDGWGSLNYSGGQTAIITSFATDWMDALATKEPTRGRSGQLGCGGYNLIAIKKPTWQGIDGLLHFDDSCDHLHIDVGDRVEQGKR